MPMLYIVTIMMCGVCAAYTICAIHGARRFRWHNETTNHKSPTKMKMFVDFFLLFLLWNSFYVAHLSLFLSLPVSCTVFCSIIGCVTICSLSLCPTEQIKKTEIIKQWLTTNKMTSVLACLVVKSQILIVFLLLMRFYRCSCCFASFNTIDVAYGCHVSFTLRPVRLCTQCSCDTFMVLRSYRDLSHSYSLLWLVVPHEPMTK